MVPTRALAAASGGATSTTPLRVAFMYVPNGVVQDAWTPLAQGGQYKLSHALEPLGSVKEHVNVITGLSQVPYGEKRGVGHALPTAALLTGVVADMDGVRVGRSVDQIIAETIGGNQRIASLQLGVHDAAINGQCDGEFSCAYSTCVSWRNETAPMPPESSPAVVFKRMFGDPATARTDKPSRDRKAMTRQSVLDYVLDDAHRLRRDLGRDDHYKLEEYLYAVRQLERRIESAPPALGEDGIPLIDLPEEKPADYAEHVRLMGDLMVLAFQTDVTRVCTFMLGMAASDRRYHELGIREGHHELSHHGNVEQTLAKLRKIDRYNVDLFGHVVERLRDTPDGERSLLDHTIFCYASGLGNGNAHTPFDLPVLVAGGGNGAIKPGRHIAMPMDTPLNNLWLSVLHATGDARQRLGDSTGPIKALQA